MAMRQAEQRLSKVRGTLREAGLGCHKEQLGALLVVLGFEVDLAEKVCRPRPEKLEQLVLATRALIGKPRIRARWLSVVCGHWAWLMTLAPQFYSLFQAVYLFLERQKGCGTERSL